MTEESRDLTLLMATYVMPVVLSMGPGSIHALGNVSA